MEEQALRKLLDDLKTGKASDITFDAYARRQGA